jgi:competence protein ComEA
MSRADSPEANAASSSPQPATETIPLAAAASADDALDRTTPAPSLTRLIKINTATASELELLPGIGPAMAARIITHRTEKGPFRSKSDLDQVRGVGEKTLERLLPLVSFELPAAAASASSGR